jgi:hypothetical protein
MSSSRDTSRRFRIRSLRFWKMVQRKEGRSCRKVRMDLKDGYIVFVRVLKKKNELYTHTHTINRNSLSTQLICTDGKQSFFQVANLKTKLGTYPYAKIRASDVVLQEIELTDDEVRSMLPMESF